MREGSEKAEWAVVDLLFRWLVIVVLGVLCAHVFNHPTPTVIVNYCDPTPTTTREER